jgi:hypothetical protein
MANMALDIAKSIYEPPINVIRGLAGKKHPAEELYEKGLISEEEMELQIKADILATLLLVSPPIVRAMTREMTAAERLAANRLRGLAAEEIVRRQLIAEGNTILGSHVTIQTSKGARVVDHLIRTPDGRIVAVEVKSGGAVRDATQLAKDKAMATEGGTPVGQNAPENLRGQMRLFDTIERRVP